MAARLPVRVAAVNDYELVVAGVADLLRRHPDRLVVVDRLIIGDPVDTPIDVALYDTYGRVGIADEALRALLATPEIDRVAVFTLDLSPRLIEDGRTAGATGFISKALSGDEIADAIVRVASGESVVAGPGAASGPASDALDWPGREDGLTERASQVLVLAAEGMTNREIADALYLSYETVKGYMSQVLETLELRNRVEAAAYVHRSGAFLRYQPAQPEA